VRFLNGLIIILGSFVAASCSSGPDRHSMVLKAVENLGHEEVTKESLGTPHPVESENVRYILQNGDLAVPFLCKALESTNHVQVGYAAYCLQRLHSKAGSKIAERQHDSYEKLIRERGSNSELYFANGCLATYLQAVSTFKE
jgi:hypothetical protein